MRQDGGKNKKKMENKEYDEKREGEKHGEE